MLGCACLCVGVLFMGLACSQRVAAAADDALSLLLCCSSTVPCFLFCPTVVEVVGVGVCLGVLGCVLVCFSWVGLVLKGWLLLLLLLLLFFAFVLLLHCSMLSFCLTVVEGCVGVCVWVCLVVCCCAVHGLGLSSEGWLLLLVLFLCFCAAPPLFHASFLVLLW